MAKLFCDEFMLPHLAHTVTLNLYLNVTIFSVIFKSDCSSLDDEDYISLLPIQTIKK